MADDQRDKPNLGNFSGIVTALLLVVGAILVQLPLEGHRPPLSSVGFRLAGVQDVDARLWQDPFAAVAKARDKAKKANAAGQDQLHAAKTLAAQIARNSAPAGGTVVLGVMVFGGTFVGAEEYRRRTRNAVLSALMSASYLPLDPEHVGYVDTGKRRGYPSVVPYEWFQARGRKPLLVLWIDEDSLSQAPLPVEAQPQGALSRLCGLLTGLLGREALERVRIDIIGPAGSDMLLGIADELAGYRSGTPTEAPRLLEKIGLFSPFATISDEHVWRAYFARRGITNDHGLGKCMFGTDLCRADELFRGVRGQRFGLRSFVRMNAADGDVVAALFDELRQRGVGAGNQIAIVGEMDTEYATRLATEIEYAHKRDAALSATAMGDAAAASMETVHRFNYMRGLDGRLPDAATSGDETKKPAEKTRGSAQIERPDGDSQVDYLRRLRELMKQSENRMSKQSFEARPWWQPRKRQPFRAIGIVGNDYYDKLLVLQALRPAFPEAIFFTTDVDAAMLHPVDNKMTRNMIVGSGFGLALHPQLQNGAPPFRDSYQSAAYLAVAVALAADGRAEVLSHAQSEKWLKPRVWEVGRNRLFELRPPPSDASCNPNPLHCASPYDLRYVRSGYEWWGAAVTLLAAALFGLAVSMKLRQLARAALRRWWLYALVVPALVVAISCLVLPAYQDAQSWWGEPFAWFEGVSIWPSNLIRAFALAVAAGGFVYAWYSVGARIQDISDKFFTADWSMVKPGDGYAIPAGAWQRYRASMTGWRVGGRAVIEFLLLIVVFGTIWWHAGTQMSVPARSDTSLHVNRVTIILAGAWTLFLLSYIVVAVRRTNALTRELSRRTCWPDAIRKRYGLPESPSQLAHFDDWLDLQVIARQTEAVNRLVYFPFLALLLLLLARYPIFDNWTMPVELLIVIGVSFAYLFAAAVQLRRTAERARSNALRALECKLLVLQGSADASASPLAAQCRTLLEQIQKLGRGAFQPFTQQALVRATLALAGGISGATLLEYAALANF